ncbi:hypothetical protein AKG37_15145 [Bacillus australimaris]|uniref:DUF4901 domain-containing protein n=1 Tax=Bacillus australimaris TaxID=1326968 RepID=A0ABD4QME3_9BACI|nr:hypothetical protein [Bacillus australimaris]KPN12682.1 hypothetical protein AKG37_15145 [Bacillus australimaris]MBR8691624.1 hypothetical protein [Bacillus australimaris]
MNANIQQLIDQTRMKFGLDLYHLKRHSFHRYVNMFNETVYTLNMEWFPSHEAETGDDDLNPDGTAVIDVNLNTGKVESVIFVMDKTYAQNGITFKSPYPAHVIQWIEQETGLIYGEHFHMHQEEIGELIFEEKVDDVTVTPSGRIEVKWDEHGQLIYFTHHGSFMAKNLLRAEEYVLSIDKVENLAEQQVQRFDWPSFEQNRIRSIYALEEIYVKNDGTGTLPFEIGREETHCLHMNQVMEWNEPLNKAFEKKEIDINEDITAEQAFSLEPSPDTFPISKEEQAECIKAVRTFLAQKYSKDTGKWVLKTLHRDHGYIHAILKTNDPEGCGFMDKIKVFIDASSFEAINYIDKKEMFQVCGILNPSQAASEINISKKEAFETLRERLELTPIYVYDAAQKQYVLCGKLDCHYGVDAVSGEVISLKDL